MEERQINVCRDCVYFSQHYIKYGEEFIPIEYGSCMCDKLGSDKRRQFSIYYGCGFHKKKEG